MNKQLIEGKDFYYDSQGYMVLTALYHLNKGHCCGFGCKHCPYDYECVPEPKKAALMLDRSILNKIEDSSSISCNESNISS